MVDQHLVTGFMDAIQMFSETMGAPVRQMQLANMMLYVRTYGDFSLRLLLQEKMTDQEIDLCFEALSKESTALLASGNPQARKFPNRETFEAGLLPILAPMIQDPLLDVRAQHSPAKDSISKIAIAGLAKAGKTSIRKMFFENWSKDMVKGVRPTISVDISRRFLDFLEHNFLIMDFGGQQTYRKLHLAAKKKWKNVSAIIFVVDIQDSAAFEPAKKYLAKLMKVISKTNKKTPRLSIFLHKNDPAIQESLSKNMSEGLSWFKEYSEVANFHLTTIEDSSSNIAMIKSLYFSLPSVMIRRLLEEEFLNHFEEVILPQFSMFGRNPKLLEELRSDIHRSAVILGMTYSVSLQESWLNYLMGEGIPKRRPLSHKSLKVTQKGQSIYVRIPRWPEEEISSELTTILLEGMLKGMLKTFHLEAPAKIDVTEAYTTWKLQL